MGRATGLHQATRPQGARAHAVAAARGHAVDTADPGPVATVARAPLVPLQQSIGNRAVGGLVQAKLKLSALPDPGITCEPARSSAPAIVHEVLRSPGQPLDAGIRAYFEPRYGDDFSRVRVHTDARAAQSAEAVGAQAYTVGQHVVFGEHRPSPAAFAGRQLWAHELAHVVQQTRGGPGPEVSRSAPHEQEARAAAMGVAMGRASVRIACHTGVGLARAPRWVDVWWQTAEDKRIRQSLKGTRDVLEDAKREAQGFLEGLGKKHPGGTEAANLGRSRRRRGQRVFPRVAQHEPIPADWLEQELRKEVEKGGPKAAQAQRHLDNIQGTRKLVSEAEDELRVHRGKPRKVPAPPSPSGGSGSGPRAGPPSGSGGGGAQGTAKVEQTAAKAEQTVAKVEQTVAKAAQTGLRAEQVAANAEAGFRRPFAARAASKLGFAAKTAVGALSIIDPLLLPGPLDALALMVKFAGSYAEAHEAIRNRNTRTGFAIGLSANLLNRSFGAVRKHLTRRFVLDREVHTQVLGAVGMAERSHNAGLSAGFRYGELLSDDVRDALREIGFSALAAQGRLPESRDELFAAEGVWRLAGTLLPTVDQIFEAMRVQAEAERRAKQAQEARERYERGESGAGMRFE